jgi:hypothetical protein
MRSGPHRNHTPPRLSQLTVVVLAWLPALAASCGGGSAPDPNGPPGAADVQLSGDAADATSAAPTSPPPPPCGLLYDATIPACEACFEEGCCDTGKACLADADCLAVLVCLEGCGTDTSCGKQCAAAHKAGTTTLRAALTCAQAACAAACPE